MENTENNNKGTGNNNHNSCKGFIDMQTQSVAHKGTMGLDLLGQLL